MSETKGKWDFESDSPYHPVRWRRNPPLKYGDEGSMADYLNALEACASALKGMRDFIDDIRQDGSCDFWKPTHEPGESFFQETQAALAALQEARDE